MAAALSGEIGTAATAYWGENGEGEEDQELTAVPVGIKAGSGKVGAERGGEADLRRPRRGRASGRRFGALPVTWLSEGVGDEVQELGSSSGHRRNGGGRGNGERRRWACSVAS